jgi:hypothetical protein
MSSEHIDVAAATGRQRFASRIEMSELPVQFGRQKQPAAPARVGVARNEIASCYAESAKKMRAFIGSSQRRIDRDRQNPDQNRADEKNEMRAYDKSPTRFEVKFPHERSEDPGVSAHWVANVSIV